MEKKHTSPEHTSLRDILELFWVFFKIGAVTFGGGLAMLPILERELAEKRDWTTKDQLLDYYAIGQSTPGIIAANVATFLGYTRAGVLGSVVATVGVVVPSVIIISVIARFFSRFTDIPQVKSALAGVNVAVAASLVKIVWGFKKNWGKSVWTFLLFAAAFAAITFFGVPTGAVIILAGVGGAALHAVRETRK